MRKIALSAVALVGAVAMVGVSALPASAASTTTTTTEVTAGALTISTPASLALTNVAPGATATGTLTGVEVSDLTADAIGWTASISISDFTSTLQPSSSIPSTGVNYVPTTAAVTGTVTVANTTADTGAGAVQTASAVTGNNTATWDATVNVAIPSDALAATDYTATLTHSFS
ncbi:hypothetical protein [Cryobacterium psychrophilum]|uniref:WxL domain-containing protein n=1 Tax=Cryobacterium psychrophilum TaxID=41988 RepID=A0A4Y8KKU0_9MICO|nr:hypothetical protein [Cryobacterium psychrophilum]TDW26900.1 hypothetical protein EDD25_3462 [Cryobacterium psychrophilum]TFD75309.1 hypothetical protein E3T53_16010 [Cryobacterium psychrophilum]